ncbi:hypothetical protein FACS189461_0520 [Spirochaetia bacterium]|nr:hypothetical protein FACS189461_0520 [Spirochaetia bacterium]
MLWPGIKKLGKELQLKRTTSEVVGMVNNCFVKMYDGSNIKVLELFVPELDNSDKENIINKLQLNKIKKYDWMANGVKITFQEIIRPYSIKKIKNVLTELTEYFDKKYPGKKPQCHKCGIQKNADVYCIGNDSLYLCDDCLKECENILNNNYFEYQQLPTNYLQGFIGALLFSIPGILLTIIFFVFLNSLAAVSALLYIFLGIKGYKKFKGKMTPFGALLIIAVGIIMTGTGVIIAYAAMILKELKTFDIEMLLNILKMQEVQKEMKANMVLSYIVSGFFFIFQFFQMVKEWTFKIDIQKAKDI